MDEKKRKERLKDRQDYRQTLIEKRNSLDRKIAEVEAEIKKLRQ